MSLPESQRLSVLKSRSREMRLEHSTRKLREGLQSSPCVNMTFNMKEKRQVASSRLCTFCHILCSPQHNKRYKAYATPWTWRRIFGLSCHLHLAQPVRLLIKRLSALMSFFGHVCMVQGRQVALQLGLCESFRNVILHGHNYSMLARE